MRKTNGDNLHRTCRCCGRTLPLDMFHRNKNEKYGRAYLCKECSNSKYREKAEANRIEDRIESLENEVWVDAVGFEGAYMVSNMGRIMSLSRESITPKGIIRHVSQRLMKQSSSRGYKIVKLRRDNRTITIQVHKLVCDAFYKERKVDETEVNHKNGIRSDNRVENLEWCNRQYNIWHSYHVTKRNPNGCKPVKCIETGVVYPSCMEAGRDLGINNSSIASVAKGIYKQMKGFHFEFIHNQ